MPRKAPEVPYKKPETWATVAWSPEDVQTLRPDLTISQAAGFLNRNESYLQDRMTELGWGVIETLLSMDEQLPKPERTAP